MPIIDAIKFNGLENGDWLVYKFYRDDLTTGARLIVSEGQKAVFIKGGEIADLFSPGTYTLDADNLPILRELIKLPFGGQTPFTAEIYFINTTSKIDLKWGFPDPLQLVDPKYGIRLRVRAFGQLGMKISDAGLFLKELIGSIDQAEMVRYDKVISFFKGFIITKIKSTIAQIIIDEKISALEISTKLEIISDKTKESIQKEVELYGMKCLNFYIQSINIPEEDLKKLTSILEQKATFDIVGDQHYVMQRSFDVYENAAKNQNGIQGIMMAGGMGIGASLGMMQGTQQLNPLGTQNKFCPKCNAKVNPNSKFCSECGMSLVPAKCQCGAILEPGAKFCSICGKKI